MDLQHGHDGGVQVVSLGLFGVHDVHRVPSTGDAKDGRKVKVLRELLRVERRRRDEELNIGPEPGDVLYQPEQHVGVQRALVSLVHHHHRVRREVGLAQKLTQEHTVGHVLELGPLGGAVLETDAVANLVPELDASLRRDARADGHSRDPPRLRATDLGVPFSEAGFPHVLGDLGGLPRPGLSDDDHNLVILDSLDQVLPVRVYGQRRPVLGHSLPLAQLVLRFLGLRELPRRRLPLLRLLDPVTVLVVSLVIAGR